MSRTIPVALQDNLGRSVQTVARCVRIATRGGLVMGFTTLDRDIVYDHGDEFGEVTYSASQGVDVSTMAADVEYSVANAEGRILVSTTLQGLTLEMVRTGALDDAEWVCFLVDYTDPSPASGAIISAGDCGEVRIEDGLVIIPEMLSYSMRLHQAIGHVWQRKCRAIFGSPAGTMTGCGVNAAALWVAGEVQSVGAEADRTLTGDVAGSFPGRLEFTSGPNAGRLYAIESANGNTVTLTEPTPYPIEVGHEYRIRPDCTKLPDGPLGCKHYGNYINFKGEDTTPVGDAMGASTPGAQMPGGGGWVGEPSSDFDPMGGGE